MGLGKKIGVGLLCLSSCFASLVAVDYYHGEKQRANYKGGLHCSISLGKRTTLQAIAENYFVAYATAVGRDPTRETVEPLLKDGNILDAKTKAKWAYRFARIRGHGLYKCYKFPISGNVVNFARSYRGLPPRPQ